MGPVDEEAAVRRYLRAVIGVPVSAGDSTDEARVAFIYAVAGWCERFGVDRRTLMDLGVDRETLDEASVWQPSTYELLRRWWPDDAFSVRDLARRSTLSESTVRQAIARDEESGLLRRAGRRGRAVVWERVC